MRLARLLYGGHKLNCGLTTFKEGREDVNDDAALDRPSMSTNDENIEAVMEMILDNRQMTISENVEDVGISCGPCQAILWMC